MTYLSECEMRRSRLEKLRDTSGRWSIAMDGIAYLPKLLPLLSTACTMRYMGISLRAFPRVALHATKSII
jgi:hypothetical protein